MSEILIVKTNKNEYSLSKYNICTFDNILKKYVEQSKNDNMLYYYETHINDDQFKIIYKIFNKQYIYFDEFVKYTSAIKHYDICIENILINFNDINSEQIDMLKCNFKNDVICCNTKENQTYMCNKIKEKKLPYVPFTIIFADGNLDYSGELNRDCKITNKYKMDPIFAYFSEWNNILFTHTFITLDDAYTACQYKKELPSSYTCTQKKVKKSEFYKNHKYRDATQEYMDIKDKLFLFKTKFNKQTLVNDIIKNSYYKNCLSVHDVNLINNSNYRYIKYRATTEATHYKIINGIKYIHLVDVGYVVDKNEHKHENHDVIEINNNILTYTNWPDAPSSFSYYYDVFNLEFSFDDIDKLLEYSSGEAKNEKNNYSFDDYVMVFPTNVTFKIPRKDDAVIKETYYDIDKDGKMFLNQRHYKNVINKIKKTKLFDKIHKNIINVNHAFPQKKEKIIYFDLFYESIYGKLNLLTVHGFLKVD